MQTGSEKVAISSSASPRIFFGAVLSSRIAFAAATRALVAVAVVVPVDIAGVMGLAGASRRSTGVAERSPVRVPEAAIVAEDERRGPCHRGSGRGLGNSASGTLVHGLAQAEKHQQGQEARTVRIDPRQLCKKSSHPAQQSLVDGDIALAATLADFFARKRRRGHQTNSPRSLSTALVMKLATVCMRRSGRTDLMIDQPVGAADRRYAVDGDQFRHRAGDEGVQDADAGAGAHRLDLAERRGDGEAGSQSGLNSAA